MPLELAIPHHGAVAVPAASGTVQLAAVPGRGAAAHGAVGHCATRGSGDSVEVSDAAGASGAALPAGPSATRRRAAPPVVWLLAPVGAARLTAASALACTRWLLARC